MAAPDVWVSKDDGSDIIRADVISGVGRDYNGHVTARLAGGEGVTVTLVVPGTQDSPNTPPDFHRSLLRTIAELSDTAHSTMVRPVCSEPRGWHWKTEPL
ncbi:MAG TPA: hypothetical protein VG253_06055 [Streptosporangiaceae bacterium]|jgi:hypothetical protein|nr:hypothetical protein [Streptosporangiaceae bacterium]